MFLCGSAAHLRFYGPQRIYRQPVTIEPQSLLTYSDQVRSPTPHSTTPLENSAENMNVSHNDDSLELKEPGNADKVHLRSVSPILK